MSKKVRDQLTHEGTTASSSSEANANTRTLGTSILMDIQHAILVCNENVACMSRDE